MAISLHSKPTHFVVTKKDMEFKVDIDPVKYISIAHCAEEIHKILDLSKLEMGEQYTALALILKKIGYHLKKNDVTIDVAFDDGQNIGLK